MTHLFLFWLLATVVSVVACALQANVAACGSDAAAAANGRGVAADLLPLPQQFCYATQSDNAITIFSPAFFVAYMLSYACSVFVACMLTLSLLDFSSRLPSNSIVGVSVAIAVVLQSGRAQAALDICNFNRVGQRAGCLCKTANGISCIDTFVNNTLFGGDGLGAFVYNVFNGSNIGFCRSYSEESGYLPYSTTLNFKAMCPTVLGFCNPGSNVACCKVAGCNTCHPYNDGCSDVTRTTAAITTAARSTTKASTITTTKNTSPPTTATSIMIPSSSPATAATPVIFSTTLISDAPATSSSQTILISTTTTPSSTAFVTNSISPTSSSSSSTNFAKTPPVSASTYISLSPPLHASIGAILGGVTAGLLVFVGVVALIVCLLQKQYKRKDKLVDDTSLPMQAQANTASTAQYGQTSLARDAGETNVSMPIYGESSFGEESLK
jgi:hypothetical protein